MDCIESPVQQVPNEVLAAILKLVPADSPIPSGDLWSYSIAPSQSWNWAWVFTRRSHSYPLDISINLESYDRNGGRAPISMCKALNIVGPHIGRWRTFALRCCEYQLEHLRALVVRLPRAASRLQSVSISLAEKVNTKLDLADFTAFRSLRSLDIDLEGKSTYRDAFHRILGPSSPLQTLVIRNLLPNPEGLPEIEPIVSPAIRALAISLCAPFYAESCWDYPTLGGFDSFANRFSFPNLEHLEFLGGFTGSDDEQSNIAVPEEWEAPLFPHLRTLRLEDVGFSADGLAFIQSLSRGITALQLIYTTGNHCLLEQHNEDTSWPALRSVTVETLDGVSDPEWLVSFIAMRASLGAHRRISELTLSPSPGDIALPIDSPPEIRWLCDGPSPALLDNAAGDGFYLDESDMRTRDFEPVVRPEPPKQYCFEWDPGNWTPIDGDWRKRLRRRSRWLASS
ncbi:hypothetical protein DFH06DRAFT_1334718 [Mycena polygramma]|nr:hypothetical protein DFH06DRAFT_1334718 [Mycena polygramma]